MVCLSGNFLDEARKERCEVPLILEKSVEVMSRTFESTGRKIGKQAAAIPKLGSSIDQIPSAALVWEISRGLSLSMAAMRRMDITQILIECHQQAKAY